MEPCESLGNITCFPYWKHVKTPKKTLFAKPTSAKTCTNNIQTLPMRKVVPRISYVPIISCHVAPFSTTAWENSAAQASQPSSAPRRCAASSGHVVGVARQPAVWRHGSPLAWHLAQRNCWNKSGAPRGLAAGPRNLRKFLRFSVELFEARWSWANQRVWFWDFQGSGELGLLLGVTRSYLDHKFLMECTAAPIAWELAGGESSTHLETYSYVWWHNQRASGKRQVPTPPKD